MRSRAQRQPDLVTSYDGVLKVIHWASLLLVAAAFLAVWGSHVAASREQSRYCWSCTARWE
ncbi:MAG: hypothetical protein WA633_10685 [Stellaceae bacterium]